MADGRRVTCMSCGRKVEEVGPISWRGNCGDCGRERLVQALDELHEHRGPIYRRWRRRIIEGIERTPA